MHRLCLLSLTLLPPALAQTPSTDSQTLQLLLTEVRQLRQELKTTTVAIQRSQILIYRVQTQEAVVARAQQRLDDAHAKLAQTQATRKELGAQNKNREDRLANVTNPAEQKQLEDTIARMKTYDDTVAQPEEQQRQAKVTDCEQQLRQEQDKLTDLQDQLDQLDTALKKF